MSRHIFKTEFEGEPVEIVMGWDRPLQGYFLTVEKIDDRGTFLFNNLELEVSHPKSLGAFLVDLQDSGLLHLWKAIPEKMIDEVTMDGVCNTGNKVVVHEVVDGRYRRQE